MLDWSQILKRKAEDQRVFGGIGVAGGPDSGEDAIADEYPPAVDGGPLPGEVTFILQRPARDARKPTFYAWISFFSGNGTSPVTVWEKTPRRHIYLREIMRYNK
jgi:hypothetical protein